ncbi:MAG: M20/M25/M40 family metallo-hydrolase [Bryobacteraceae bacterium]
MTVSASAKSLLAPLEGELVHLLQALVRTDTVAIPPHGKEAAGQAVIEAFLGAHGIRAEVYDTAFVTESGHPRRRLDRDYRGRPNLLAAITGTGRGRSLLLNAHIDTVPAGRNPWTGSPWSGEIRGERLFGRGSVDMKGGLAAGFVVLGALHRAGVRLGGDLYCESVVDEEWGGGGGTLAARLHGPSADACVIPEGTQEDIALATRGGAIVDLTCEAGDAAGYFSADEVVSPSFAVGRLLGWMEQWSLRRRQIPRGNAYRDFPDPAPVQVLAIEANRIDPEEPFRVPLQSTVRLYMQFLPHEQAADVLSAVRASLDEFCAADPFFRHYPVTWQSLIDPPLEGHELSPEHPWSRSFYDSVTAALGKAPLVTAAPYPCDAFLVQREFAIPTLLFGPRGGGGHNTDEYVEIPSVLKTAEVMLTAALEWCGE